MLSKEKNLLLSVEREGEKKAKRPMPANTVVKKQY
jgi:hypothetical protein